jgi:hypothetical protein
MQGRLDRRAITPTSHHARRHPGEHVGRQADLADRSQLRDLRQQRVQTDVPRNRTDQRETLDPII